MGDDTEEPDTDVEETEAPPVDTPADTPEEVPDVVKTVLLKERKAARDAERRAKVAERERDDLKAKHMTDSEKAVEAARAEGRAEALKVTGVRLVDAEVRAAAAGRKGDVAALLEGLDRTKFITDDGEPDTKAIGAWVDKVLPAKAGPLDLGQGARGSAPAADMNQLIRDRMRR